MKKDLARSVSISSSKKKYLNQFSFDFSLIKSESEKIFIFKQQFMQIVFNRRNFVSSCLFDRKKNRMYIQRIQKLEIKL